MADTCKWRGESGEEYTYNIYAMDAVWADVGGNYIFAKQVGGIWTQLYIGETQSFRDRLPTHEALPCVLRNSGTYIHAHMNTNSQARLDEESDLIANNPPPCIGMTPPPLLHTVPR